MPPIMVYRHHRPRYLKNKHYINLFCIDANNSDTTEFGLTFCVSKTNTTWGSEGNLKDIKTHSLMFVHVDGRRKTKRIEVVSRGSRGVLFCGGCGSGGDDRGGVDGMVVVTVVWCWCVLSYDHLYVGDAGLQSAE